ncbi:unnamed protein product, partial [Ectocarpus fasciculatus]
CSSRCVFGVARTLWGVERSRSLQGVQGRDVRHFRHEPYTRATYHRTLAPIVGDSDTAIKALAGGVRGRCALEILPVPRPPAHHRRANRSPGRQTNDQQLLRESSGDYGYTRA